MQPTFFIGGGNGVSLVEAPLLALGWKRINDKHDERYKLKWVECKGKINYTSFREGDQLANHIPNGYLLTNKLGLTNSLQEYERVSILTKGRPPKLRIADFLPITYRLDDKNDREAFLQAYKEGETWICKPTGMNQGKGIFLLRSLEEINQLISERDVRQRTSKPTRPLMSRIVQKYISNPLLLEDRKFDIRAYMLLASTVPYCILYHKGYVRLSCTKFDNEDPNLITHLTNQFVQKKDPRYKDVKEDTAWSMDKLNDYVNEHFMEEKGLERDWVYNTLTKQMQRIIYHCFNSVRHKLQCKIGYFDLYGLDFMIDTDMKVWLIEVNVNPALHVNCEALREVIPGVVEETLYLAIECFEKSRRSQPLLPLQSLKNFSLLHCSVTPNAVVPRHPHPRSSSPSKEPQIDRSKGSQTAPTRRTASPGRPAARPGTLSSGNGSSSHNSAAPGSQGPTRRSEMGLALKGAEPAASATPSQTWKPGASSEESPSKSHSESTSARPRETRPRPVEAPKPRSSGAVRKSSEEGSVTHSGGNRAPPQPLNLTFPLSQGAKVEEASSVKLKMTHGAPTSGRRRELPDRGN